MKLTRPELLIPIIILYIRLNYTRVWVQSHTSLTRGSLFWKNALY
jgi:hypothetical protein